MKHSWVRLRDVFQLERLNKEIENAQLPDEQFSHINWANGENSVDLGSDVTMSGGAQ